LKNLIPIQKLLESKNLVDDEQAKSKIDNWFNVLMTNGILKSYDIKSTEVRSLYETLEDKKILDVLTHNNPQ
jgi:hypothetical protein